MSKEKKKKPDQPQLAMLQAVNQRMKPTYLIGEVKCTSADIFRVQPPLGFIKPGETGTIRMWFQNKEIPEGHRHYFAIYHVKCTEGKTVKEIWTKSVKPDGVKRIAAVFEKLPPPEEK
ncbi:MSP domain protein [Necator americanus]|uniref:MSP domain protein n=1 Tax=Necator americanus TaxID=51031 RepID=W2TQ02_NECAM|nr:MSP domain protein [Necator americanus]ETN83206.1 MSP domain protein [Necator americanus]